MRIVAPPGVFKPIVDTWMLAEELRRHPRLAGAEVLDLCTGSGALAVAAAVHGARRVTAVDVSHRAVLTARLNARLNGARVRTLRGDLLAPVAGERFDLIMSNPPYVPSGGGALPRRGRERAWEGGPAGRALLDRICDDAPRHLRPGGSLLLVQSSISGEQATLERLRAAGLEARVIARRRGPLGPLMGARAAALERQGLLAPGAREEELIVIEGADGRLEDADPQASTQPRTHLKGYLICADRRAYIPQTG
jgi:release factor glutamine methyltransferase